MPMLGDTVPAVPAVPVGLEGWGGWEAGEDAGEAGEDAMGGADEVESERVALVSTINFAVHVELTPATGPPCTRALTGTQPGTSQPPTHGGL